MVTGNIVAALRGRVKFQSGNHTQLLTNVHAEIRCRKSHEAGEDLSDDAEEVSPK